MPARSCGSSCGCTGSANVTVLPMALGAACGVETLSVPLKSSGSYGFGLSHLGAPQERWHAVAQELVAMTTIDAVAAALALDRLDFIKADIEGWELSLLRGAANTLQRFRPHMLIELSAAHLARTGEPARRRLRLFDRVRLLGVRTCTRWGIGAGDGRADGDFWFISARRPGALDELSFLVSG